MSKTCHDQRPEQAPHRRLGTNGVYRQPVGAGRAAFLFAYTVTITNAGLVPAKLLTRHWVITDGNERVQEVRGVGVVGEQPHLSPGMSFEYTSGTVLETPIGTMQGSYQMLADDGTKFDAEIAPFLLTVPRQLH